MRPLNRKERILKLIVEQFVQTAEPVGSSSLTGENGLPYSSATIRNEMAELENMGFLEKTHTSSGRVPSAKGYRYYVDNLRNEIEDESIRYQIQSLFEVKKHLAVEEAIKHGCEIIAQMTNLTSVVLGPDAQFESIRKIQLVPLDEKSAVAVFVTDRGHVEHRTFGIPKDVSYNDLETCVNIINDRVVGTPLSQVIEKVEALKPLLSEKVNNFELVFKAFLEAFLRFTYDRVSVFGKANILEQPEFTNNIEKLKKFINFIEKDDVWKQLGDSEGISVKIGSENDLAEFDDLSVITAPIMIDDTQKGTVVLVGPTRMDYQRVLSAVKYLQKQLNDFFKIESLDQEE